MQKAAASTVGRAVALLARELPVAIHHDGCGARVTLPNGAVVSIVTGWGTYSSTGRSDDSRDAIGTLGRARDAEVAAFGPCGSFLACSKSLADDDAVPDTVWGWQSPGDVLAFVDRVAAIRPDGQCFCPNCNRG